MRTIAVIADLVGSKQLARREAFQRRLAAVLAARSAEAEALASPFTLTLGDEFQALYRGAASVLRDVVTIWAEIHPVQARVALGVGELATRLNTKQALGMDGPAFHAARAALQTLKDEGGLLRIDGDRDADWALVNRALNLLSHQVEGWSRNRLLVLAGLMRGRSVRELESAVKISHVAVYKNIRAAALDEVAGLCQEITRALDQALRTT